MSGPSKRLLARGKESLLSSETCLKEDMDRMEEFYKNKLSDTRSQLKRAEEALSSFKDRMAEDLSVSLDAAIDTENMMNPVNVTRLQEMYHHLRVNEWPNIRGQIRHLGPDRARNIIQGVFKAAVTRMDSVKKALFTTFTENMPQKELPTKVQDHLRCSLDNLQLALFHCSKQDLPCEAVMDAPETCRELLSELYWLFCLMVLSKTPLQPQWDSYSAANPWDCLPDQLTQFTREDLLKPSDVGQRQQSPLNPEITQLEQDIVTFVRKTFLRLQTSERSSERPENTSETEEQRSTDALLNTTVDFLSKMDQKELAERLRTLSPSTKQREQNRRVQSSTMKHDDHLRDNSSVPAWYRKLKSHLQQQLSQVCEGGATAGDSAPLQQIYTELFLTEQSSDAPLVFENVFKERPICEKPKRTVLTVGAADVGKTVLTQKFCLDWAEGRAHQNIQLLLPFTFRELMVLRQRKYSLVGLVHHFFSQTKDLCSFEGLQVLFILDGLDECRPPLDFCWTRVLTDPSESASVEELLVNLIRGKLLPSARLWITTRTAAASQIPAWCVSMVTEARGFTDPQKEQFFRKSFTDEQQATAVMSHIQNNPSLRIVSRPSAEGLQKLLVKASRKANLSSCNLNLSSCSSLASVLSSSSLTHLDLSNNDLQDSGADKLCEGLKSATCRLHTLSLSNCNLTERSCSSLASVLSSSSLTDLDLSNNDLRDSGVNKLCEGLKSATCRLHTLRLSGCLITEGGGDSLASALNSTSSRLRELDLRYNHPGPSKRLTALWSRAPHGPLQTLRLEPAGDEYLTPGLYKYFCELSLDPNTANRRLKLSEKNHKVTYISHVQLHTDNNAPILCSPDLTGRCYWEVEFYSDNGSVYIGVTTDSGKGDSELGKSPHSWALKVSRGSYRVFHDGKPKVLPHNPPSSSKHSPVRVAVYLDYEAGSLFFYEDSLGKLIPLCSFQTKFTERLYAGFRLRDGSVTLCTDSGYL